MVCLKDHLTLVLDNLVIDIFSPAELIFHGCFTEKNYKDATVSWSAAKPKKKRNFFELLVDSNPDDPNRAVVIVKIGFSKCLRAL